MPVASPRQALTLDPQGKRKRGRPRNTWLVETDVEMLRRVTPGREREKNINVFMMLLFTGYCFTPYVLNDLFTL